MVRRYLTVLAVFCQLALSTTAGSASKPSEKGARPTYGGTLIIGIASDIDSFNPLFNESALAQEITHLLLLGLADLNEKSEFSPELASSWESSDDYLTLTYHLRKDALWSDGVPITADDVKFTFDVLMDTTAGSPRYGATEFLKAVRVEDSHTVTFEFTEAYPAQLFDTAGEILPRHLLENADRASLRSHKFGRNPLSSGPFVLKKWVSQQYIELAANEKYYGGRPYLDRVIFKIVPDNTNLLLQIQTGEVDMMIGVPPSEVERLQKSNKHISIHPVSGRVYHYISYNQKNPLFSDVRVRQALTMAIDRQGIIKAVLYGFGKPCQGPLSSLTASLDSGNGDIFAHDPERATKLLHEAGWLDTDHDGWLDKDGRTFKFTIKTNAGNQLRSDVAVIVQSQMKKIGIEVRLQTIEWSTLVGQLRTKDFEAHMGGWSTPLYVDLTPIFHSSAQNLFNVMSYANTEVDRLIESGREEMDRQKSMKIWNEAQRLIYQDQPYTFLFWVDRIIAVSDKFNNVTPIPLSALYGLEKWYQASN